MTEGDKHSKRPSIHFGAIEWHEEVERLVIHSQARSMAERSRHEILAGRMKINWKQCLDPGPDGTCLTRCLKLYIPLNEEAPSRAPFGFVFQLHKDSDGKLFAQFIAFGERHPANPRTWSVYARAHRRLHGRYPDP